VELILDVSSATATVAFAEEGLLTWRGEPITTRDHSTMMLPRLLDGLAALDARTVDISLVIVATGPGPFNGLRVAVSIAKGVALGAGVPVVATGSLEVEACRYPTVGERLRIVLRAGRTTHATASFTRTGDAWQQDEESRVLDTEEVLSLLGQSETLLGADIDDAIAERLSEHIRESLVAPHCPRLSALAALGYRRAMSGGVVPVAALQPTYARPPHITTPRERRN